MSSLPATEDFARPIPNRWRGVLYAFLLGLVGAGIVHGVVLLAIPNFSKRDAWNRLTPISDEYNVIRVGPETLGGPVVGAADPSFLAAVCRFELTDGPVRVIAPGKVPFWSASVYGRDGANLFSLTDRSATDGVLDLVILRPEQMIETRKNPRDDFEKSIHIELPLRQAIVLVRVFVPDSSWTATIEAFLANASCKSQP